LARWVELAADWLKPIYEQIRTGVMGGGYVQVDETPVDYLEPGNGKTKQGYLWTCSRPGGDVFYRWETSRAAACLDNIIPGGFYRHRAVRWLLGLSLLCQRTRPRH
jgi:transposase